MTPLGEKSNFSTELEEDHRFSLSELIGLVEVGREAGHPGFPQIQLDACALQANSNQNVYERGSDARGSNRRFWDTTRQKDDKENLDLEMLKDSPARKKRKKKADPSTWKREVEKANRMKGEGYLGFKVVTPSSDGNRKAVFGKSRVARVMGQRCRSSYCQKRSAIKCEEFSEEDRKDIFKYFWKNLDWEQKRQYVAALIDTVPVKRRKKSSSKRRNDTLIYCLKLNEKRVQVCRKMFLSTLGLKMSTVLRWVKTCKSGIPKISPKKKRESVVSERILAIHQFLDALPKLPSHYCRKSTSKLYLETHITTKAQLIKLYEEYCSEKHLPVSSRPLVYKVLDTKNIGIFTPRKDRCDLCVGYENGKVPENEYNQHCHRKNLARDHKSADKSDALEGMCHVLTMDLQAVKLSPVLNASSLYFKTKLMSHNFTVFNLKTHDAVCYWWDETEGDLSSSSFASCVTDYIRTYLKDSLPIIIYSDGCVSQNKNHMLSNSLLELAISSNRIIIQKFLEKGHTQMECDSVHAVIESALKNKHIYVPDDYLKITEACRTRQPYIVRKLDHTFFQDFTGKKSAIRYSSIRPGVKTGDACVTNLKNIKYLPEGKIQYKLSYEDAAWTDLPEKPKRLVSISCAQLFTSRRSISSRKFKDLQDLKAVIPETFHAFYDAIPHKED